MFVFSSLIGENKMVIRSYKTKTRKFNKVRPSWLSLPCQELLCAYPYQIPKTKIRVSRILDDITHTT